MNGLKVNYNERLNGIELFFDTIPSADIISLMKQPEHRFFWYGKEKKWYGKKTPEREAFVNNVLLPLYTKESVHIDDDIYMKEAREKAAQELEGFEDLSADKKKNVFASFYDTIDNNKIYKDSSLDFVDFRNSFNHGYFKDKEVYVRLYSSDREVIITDLSNATQKGETVKEYRLSVDPFEVESITLYLCNELKVKTIDDLVALIKEEKDLGKLQFHVSEVKGVEVFSPFKEMEPLKKLPQHWTRSHLQRALMSGQIFDATMEYSYTDDYVFDAALNYKKGQKVHLPSLAKDSFERWCRTQSILCENVNGNTATLNLVDSNSSIKLSVDLDYNIEKSIQRREEEQKEIKEYNEEISKEIVNFDEVSIKPNGFYSIVFLVKEDNTGKFVPKNRLIQGANLYNDDFSDFAFQYGLMKQVEHLTICPDKLYQLSSFNNPVSLPTSDERFIPLGNREIVVFGQALKEMATEMVFPFVSDRPSCGQESCKAKETICAFIDGQMYWTCDVSKVDYKESLNRLNKEEQRIHSLLEEKSQRKSLSDLIASADAERKSNQTGSMNHSEQVQNKHNLAEAVR